MNLFTKWLDLIHTGGPEDIKSAEDNWKRTFVFTAILIAIPVISGYGFNFLINENLVIDALLNLSVAFCFLVVAILMKLKKGGALKLYRICAACLIVLLVYNLGFGPHGESEALWLLIFPMFAFYLFGMKEGGVWVSLLILPSAIFLFFPDIFHSSAYPVKFRISLAIAMILSVFVSLLLESLRAHFIFGIEQKNRELNAALADVKKLSGLLPICASCKKIRDDKGYWNQIEEYIRSHSEAEFSHSICPECTRKLYPQLNLPDV